jgi:hypothetical protein
MLEPYAVKVASTVLKGLEAGNGLRLLTFILNKIHDLDTYKYIYHIFLYFELGRLKKTL